MGFVALHVPLILDVKVVTHILISSTRYQYNIELHVRNSYIINVTRFAKTRNNPAFLKTQIIASWCSAHLKPSSVAVSSL